MTTGSSPEVHQGLDFSGILILVWRRKFRVLAIIAASFALGVFYLQVAQKSYATELKVTAAASSSNSIGSRLGNLGGLAAVAGLPIGGSSKAEPFDLYLEALTSRSVSDRLAKDPLIMRTIFSRDWDSDRRIWRQPLPTVTESARALLGLGNVPWRAPDGARLREYLQREIVITKNSKTPITMIGYEAVDPAFGVHLLAEMNRLADNQVRVGALQRATEFQAYLTGVLPTVGLAEVRQSLATALTQQYESVMMAKSTLAYSALALSAPQVSLAPTRPKVTIILALSLLLGVIVGLAAALVDFRRLINGRQVEVLPYDRIDV